MCATCVHCLLRPERVLYLLELEFQTVVSRPKWVLVFILSPLEEQSVPLSLVLRAFVNDRYHVKLLRGTRPSIE